MMELCIISPEGAKKFDIAWLEIETPVGNFVIHGGHAPTLLTLLPNHDIIFKLKSGEQEFIPVPSGVVDISREGATVIINE